MRKASTVLLLRSVLFIVVLVGLWPPPIARRPIHRRSAEPLASVGPFESAEPLDPLDRARAPGARPSLGPGRRRAWAVVAAASVAVAAIVIPVAAVALAGAIGLAVAHSRRAATRRARNALIEALPDALDLCAVVLGAGGTIPDAVAALADHGPLPARSAAAAARRRTTAGLRLDDALRLLRDDLGPVFQPLTGVLLLANQQGGAVGVLLARLASEASGSRRRLGELRARRLPVALLGPLILCSLPAVLIGAVVPLVLVALSAIEL
jgi:Flp pilus assembly protein TadB